MAGGYVAFDGGRVWYQEAGRGPAVLLLHAGGADSRMWDGHLERFARLRQSDGRVIYHHRAARPHTTQTVFEPGEITELPRVDVVVSYIDADGSLIDAAVAAGARGIVSAGTARAVPPRGDRRTEEGRPARERSGAAGADAHPERSAMSPLLVVRARLAG